MPAEPNNSCPWGQVTPDFSGLENPYKPTFRLPSIAAGILLHTFQREIKHTE
jgi:hypothetical protein